MFDWMLYNAKDLVRDRSNIFFVMIFPILMVFILGNMLAELDNADSPIGTINIAVYSDEALDVTTLENDLGLAINDWPEGASDIGSGAVVDEELLAGLTGGMPVSEHMGKIAEAQAVSSFISGLAESEGIEITRSADAPSARAEAETGSADAAMIFRSPLSIEVTEGGNIYKNRAALLIAQSFARQYAAFKTAALHSPEIFTNLSQDGTAAFSDMTEDKDLGVSRTMIDYYAVTMIVMIIFMGGGIGGASTTFLARQDGSLRRMSASPRSRARLFIESVIGALPINIIQAGIVMVLSTVFMGAHYANTWQDNLLLFVFFLVIGLTVSSVFMLAGLFMKINPYIPIMAVLWAMLFISGSFSKDIYIEGVTGFMPMNIIQRAAFDLTVFGRSEQVQLVMGVCAIIFAVACVIGSALYKRKETMF